MTCGWRKVRSAQKLQAIERTMYINERHAMPLLCMRLENGKIILCLASYHPYLILVSLPHYLTCVLVSASTHLLIAFLHVI